MSAVWRIWTSRRAAWALHILFRGDGEAAGGDYNGINIAEGSESIDESKTADGRCSCRPPRRREARVGDYGRAAGIAGGRGVGAQGDKTNHGRAPVLPRAAISSSSSPGSSDPSWLAPWSRPSFVSHSPSRNCLSFCIITQKPIHVQNGPRLSFSGRRRRRADEGMFFSFPSIFATSLPPFPFNHPLPLTPHLNCGTLRFNPLANPACAFV